MVRCKYCVLHTYHYNDGSYSVKYLCYGQRFTPECPCAGNPIGKLHKCPVHDAHKVITQEKADNKYWNNICEIAHKQRSKGLREYGQGLENNITPSAVERLTYIQEELVDALMYCEWLKDKLEGDK